MYWTGVDIGDNKTVWYSLSPCEWFDVGVLCLDIAGCSRNDNPGLFSFLDRSTLHFLKQARIYKFVTHKCISRLGEYQRQLTPKSEVWIFPPLTWSITRFQHPSESRQRSKMHTKTLKRATRPMVSRDARQFSQFECKHPYSRQKLNSHLSRAHCSYFEELISQISAAFFTKAYTGVRWLIVASPFMQFQSAPYTRSLSDVQISTRF